MKLLFVSLGCDKNLVDTEFMLGMLRDDGIEITNDETEADIIIRDLDSDRKSTRLNSSHP